MTVHPRSALGRIPGLPIAAVLIGALVGQIPLQISLFGAGAMGLFLLSLLSPLVVLVASLIIGPFGATENILLGRNILEGGQWLFLLATAGWLARGALRREVIIGQSSLYLPLGIFVVVSAISLYQANSLDYGAKEIAKWLEIGLAINLVKTFGREIGRKRTVVVLMSGLLISVFIQAVIGIWQFAFQSGGPEHFLILGRFYRATGTFQQPNPYGGFMSIGTCLVLGTTFGFLMKLIVDFRNKLPQPKVNKVISALLLFLSVFLLAGLVVSWSRGAWLGFMSAGIFMLLFAPMRFRYGVVAVGLTFLFLYIAYRVEVLPPALIDRVSSIDDDFRLADMRGVDINDQNYSAFERLAHWQAAFEMAREHIWLGVGFGNYEPVYAKYALINWPFPLGHAHNYYLNVLAETGVIGLISYLGFWLVVLLGTIRLIRRLNWPGKGVALGLLGGWIALSTHHLVDKLYVNNLFIFFGVMLGIQQILSSSND